MSMEEKKAGQTESMEVWREGRVTTCLVHKLLQVSGKTLSWERSRAKKKGNLKE